MALILSSISFLETSLGSSLPVAGLFAGGLLLGPALLLPGEGRLC